MGSYEPGDEPNRCTAKSKTTGNRCTKTVVPGRAVCRYHGGLGGRPIKHGRYSKSLGSLREAYEASRSDPTLLELRDTLAILDLNVQRAAQRVDKLDTPKFREQARDLYRQAQAATDTNVMRDRLRELGSLLDQGASEDVAFRNLTEAVERLAKRQEKAWDLRLSAANVINARDMVVLLSRFADIVIDESDPELATRIISRIDAEVMGADPRTSDRLATGGDPLGPASPEVPGQSDRLHDGSSGLDALGETEGDR